MRLIIMKKYTSINMPYFRKTFNGINMLDSAYVLRVPYVLYYPYILLFVHPECFFFTFICGISIIISLALVMSKRHRLTEKDN